MEFSASQIATWVEGTIQGDENVAVSKLAKIEEADPKSITFLSNPKYQSYLKTTQAGIVIVNQSLQETPPNGTTFIRVEDAYASFTKLLTYYNQYRLQKSGIEPQAYIAESAKVGENAYVGAFAYIGENVTIGENCQIYPHAYIGDNVTLGDNTTLYAGAKIYHECQIGSHCIIHAGAVVGSDGFGFAPNPQTGEYAKIPQIGNVVVKDHVEIGACCTIDRATMGSTVVEKGVKLDNQIQVAHNVVIGDNTVIASQTGIAGSTKVGKNAMIGGQVGISGHLEIGDFVQVQAQSGINQNTPAKEQLYGSPAMKATDFRKSYVYFRKLPALVKRIEQLEKLLKGKE